MDIKYQLSKFSTARYYDVKQATDILQRFGIAHNEKKTRDLIGKGKLVAKSNGSPNDRRSGYSVSEKALYDLVVTEIPIMKEVFEHFNAKKPTKKAPIKAVKPSPEESKA